MNQHPDLETLLALRDGHDAGAAAAHVADCATCRAELARLAALREGLRALPAVPPSPELWARVVAAVEPPVTVAARRSRMRLAVSGVAAALALAVGIGLYTPGAVEAPATGDATAAALATAGPSIGDLKQRSQRLEAVLTALESQPRVTTARSAGAIAELEDGIALVDWQLGQIDPARPDASLQRALWKKRVELMESLVTVRYSGERADSI